jgi:hypothetical protein
VCPYAGSSVILVWMYSSGTGRGTGKARSLAILLDKNGRMVKVLEKNQPEVH